MTAKKKNTSFNRHLKRRSKELWASAVEGINMPTISYSEVDTYRRCQKRWEYRYKIGLKKLQKHVRLLKGEILHEMLNALIKQRMAKGKSKNRMPDPWDVLEEYAAKYAEYFDSEKEHYGDIIGDCEAIFLGYLRKYRKDPLKYEESEVGIFLDLPNGLRFVGFIDKIALDEQERRLIVDHKFNERIPTADDRFSELQLLLYFHFYPLAFPDKKIDGLMWDYCRAKAPSVPKVLASGKGLSQDKRIDTDVETYMRAIKDNGFDPTDYEEMLHNLIGKEDTFFERVTLPKPSEHLVNEVVSDFMATADEIKSKRAKKAHCVRSMNPFNCNTCEYRPICEAEVRGHDADFIIKSDYREREMGDD